LKPGAGQGDARAIRTLRDVFDSRMLAETRFARYV
jgi:hypothetical protein